MSQSTIDFGVYMCEVIRPKIIDDLKVMTPDRRASAVSRIGRDLADMLETEFTEWMLMMMGEIPVEQQISKYTKLMAELDEKKDRADVDIVVNKAVRVRLDAELKALATVLKSGKNKNDFIRGLKWLSQARLKPGVGEESLKKLRCKHSKSQGSSPN